MITSEAAFLRLSSHYTDFMKQRKDQINLKINKLQETIVKPKDYNVQLDTLKYSLNDLDVYYKDVFSALNWFRENSSWINDFHYVFSYQIPLTEDNNRRINEAKFKLGVHQDNIYYVMYMKEPDESLKISDLWLGSLFNNLFSYDFDDWEGFSYNDHLRRAVAPKYTYPPLMKMSKVEEYAKLEINSRDDDDTLYQVDEDGGLSRLKYAVASLTMKKYPYIRFGSWRKQILAVLLTSQECSEKNHFVGLEYHQPFSSVIKTGFDTVGIQWIKWMLSKYNCFPWTISPNGGYIRRDAEVDFPSHLLSYIAIGLDLAYHEIHMNLTHTECKLFLEIVSIMGVPSMFDNFLKLKSLTSTIELAIIRITKFRAVYHNNNGGVDLDPSVDVNIDLMEETDCKKYFDDFFKQAPLPLSSYVRHVVKFIEHLNGKDSNLENASLMSYTVRRMFNVLRILTTTSLYNHSSITLVAEKSADPRLNTLLSSPIKEKSNIVADGHTYRKECDYSEAPLAFKLIQQRIETEFAAKISDDIMRKTNIEAEFTFSLTNNSQGHKLSPEEAKVLNVPPVIQLMSQARLINFLAQMDKYYQLEYLQDELMKPNILGSRSQINRRFRIIVMVNNAKQIISFLTLIILKQLTSKVDAIALGKQLGNLYDARIPLLGSDGQRISNSADVSGMDNSTLKHLQDLIQTMVSKMWSPSEMDRYFCFKRGEYTVVEMDEHGDKTQLLNAAQIGIAIGNDSQKIGYHEAVDVHFKHKIRITSDAFASGLFGTSAQHTILIAALLESFYDWYRLNVHNDISEITLNAMGDDLNQIINNTNETHAVDYFSKVVHLFKEINYELELIISRYYAVFLQQDGIFGTLCPSPHRISLVTRERNDSINRTPIDRFKSQEALVKQYCARSYIETPDSTLNAVWFAISVFTMKDISVGEKFKQLIWSLGNGYNIVSLPMLASNSYFTRAGFPRLLLKRLNSDHVYMTYPKYGSGMAGDQTYVMYGQIFRKKHLDDIKNNEKWEFYIDVDTMERLGILQGLYLFEYISEDILTESRIVAITPEYLEQTKEKLISFQDVGKRLRSISGRAKLLEKGIGIPDVISYSRQPEIRIEEMIKPQRLDNEERVQLRDSIINVMEDSKYKRWKMSRNTNRKFQFSLFDIKLDSIASNKYPHQLSNYVFQIVPNLMKKSRSYLLTNIMGIVINNDLSPLISLSKTLERYAVGTGAKVEDLLPVLKRIMGSTELDENLRLLIDAMGGDEILEQEIRQKLFPIVNNLPTSTMNVIVSNTLHYHRSLDANVFANHVWVDGFQKTTYGKYNATSHLLIQTRNLVFDNVVEMITRYNGNFTYIMHSMLKVIISRIFSG